MQQKVLLKGRSLAGAWHRGGTGRCLLKDQLQAERTAWEVLRAGGDLAHLGPSMSLVRFRDRDGLGTEVGEEGARVGIWSRLRGP